MALGLILTELVQQVEHKTMLCKGIGIKVQPEFLWAGKQVQVSTGVLTLGGRVWKSGSYW